MAANQTGALVDLAQDDARSGKVVRRVISRLYSTDQREKWRAVSALGAIVAGGVMKEEGIEKLLNRFVWAMSDESGAVPYGIPEALGEILAHREDLRARFFPLLVSYVVHEELIQTGPILTGAVWALGRIGPGIQEEAERTAPGLRTALLSDDPDLRGAAAWTAGRLGVSGTEAELGKLEGDRATTCLLIDGMISEFEIGELSRMALDKLGAEGSSR